MGDFATKVMTEALCASVYGVNSGRSSQPFTSQAEFLLAALQEAGLLLPAEPTAAMGEALGYVARPWALNAVARALQVTLPIRAHTEEELGAATWFLLRCALLHRDRWGQAVDAMREEAHQLVLARQAGPVRTCRHCGCTDAKACLPPAGPCWWVGVDVCSNPACVALQKAENPAWQPASAGDLADLVDAEPLVAGSPCPSCLDGTLVAVAGRPGVLQCVGCSEYDTAAPPANVNDHQGKAHGGADGGL